MSSRYKDDTIRFMEAFFSYTFFSFFFRHFSFTELLFLWFEMNVMQLLWMLLEREVERYHDDSCLVSNSTDQMTLQQKSQSVGRNLKIEMTTPTIKALWSLLLVFKWLVILLLNNVLLYDCSLIQLDYLFLLKLLALGFLYKLDKRRMLSKHSLCFTISAHIVFLFVFYLLICQKINQEEAFKFSSKNKQVQIKYTLPLSNEATQSRNVKALGLNKSSCAITVLSRFPFKEFFFHHHNNVWFKMVWRNSLQILLERIKIEVGKLEAISCAC